jgi:hypothetical protein
MTSSQNADAILMLDDEFDIVNIFTLALERGKNKYHYGFIFAKLYCIHLSCTF